MFRIFGADKDTYITDRVIRGQRVTNSNVGRAGSLDLFKLYGFVTSASINGSVPLVETSRLLVHFDLNTLRGMYMSGAIDVSNPTFKAYIRLSDVYGGQPTPSNFTVTVHPLSQSFSEGLGKDVVFYTDRDATNYVSSSINTLWHLSGANSGSSVSNIHPGLNFQCDYINQVFNNNATSGVSMEFTQLFVDGDENLMVDVTRAVSSTIVGEIPDQGFRIAYTSSIENDNKTYFVKRFASRHAYNESLRPALLVRFDDSIQDDSQTLTFNTSGTLFMYNYAQGRPATILSGVSQTAVINQNCLLLRLLTEVSGGFYELVFTGSQHRAGRNYVTGVYSASVFIDANNTTLKTKLATSGNVKFTPVWGSLDGTVAYATGSSFFAYPPSGMVTLQQPKTYIATITNIRDQYVVTDVATLRINVFDSTAPYFQTIRVPSTTPSSVIRDVHWSVRDSITNKVVVPFDTVYNSTRASSDATGMYFKFDMSSLTPNRTYVFDLLITSADVQQTYKAASAVFRVLQQT